MYLWDPDPNPSREEAPTKVNVGKEGKKDPRSPKKSG